MLQRFYHKTMIWSASPKASWWMAGLSFTESSFFLIPPDTMLIPMCLAKPARAYWFALVCTLASVAGGILGYLIGAWVFEAIGIAILDFYDGHEAFERFKVHADHAGFWLIALKALTPIPYKIVAIAAGAVELPFMTFIAASLIGRGTRFFALAWLCRRYGSEVREMMDRYGGVMMAVLVLAIVAGIYALKFV